MPEETIAGFHPMVVLDWVPQEDPLIEGHAVYLGLREVSAMKLLCWVPTSYPGHLDLPIMHKNHTHTMHDLLVEDVRDVTGSLSQPSASPLQRVHVSWRETQM